FSGIVISASDGSLSASNTIAINVAAINQAPIVVPLYPQSAREGTALQFTLAADDPNGDQITYSAVSGLPTDAQINPVTGQFTWTPGFDQAGDHTIRFEASDPAGLSGTTDVQIHVDNVDRPPALSVSNHGTVVGKTLGFNLLLHFP